MTPGICGHISLALFALTYLVALTCFGQWTWDLGRAWLGLADRYPPIPFGVEFAAVVAFNAGLWWPELMGWKEGRP